ncbi:MAG: M23 family metallopeptidase [Candidatus Cloacimonetes bacterium]|nr:M23 family metallopeptidase [Candidatus Cloacimonadota bacterium]
MLIFNNRTLKNELSFLNRENENSKILIDNFTEKIEELEKQNEMLAKLRTVNDSIDTSEKKTNKLANQIKETLRDKTKKIQKLKKFKPDLMPLKGEYAISQKYSEKHPAIDLAARTGTEIISTASGIVDSVYEDEYFGKVIIIDHIFEYSTFYAHLAKILVLPGNFVEKQQVIGLVGNTGNSTAPHLHYEIILEGKKINPGRMLNLEN